MSNEPESLFPDKDPGLRGRRLRRAWLPAFESFSDEGKRLFLRLMAPCRSIAPEKVSLAVVEEVLQQTARMRGCQGKVLRLRHLRKRIEKIAVEQAKKREIETAISELGIGRTICCEQLMARIGCGKDLARSILDSLVDSGSFVRRRMLPSSPVAYLRVK